jgi:hypothetical protein
LECVDAKGARLYTDICPPGTTQRRELVKPGEGASATTGGAPPKTLQEQEIGFRKRQLERDEAAAKDEQANAKAAENAEQCNQVRGSLKALEGGYRMDRTDPDTGERTVMGDEERAAEIAKAREQEKLWCKE